ncbi:MAG: deoxyribose-phosphate aldolase [Clostridia bacterium]
MMTAGKFRRLSNITRADGRATIIAFDHGATSGPLKGIEDPAIILQKLVDGKPDAILCTIGIAEKYKEILANTGLIIRIDFPATDLVSGPSDCMLLIEVEEAVRLGADAVIMTAGPGAGVERTTMANFTKVGRDCDKYGMPFIAEMYPGGFNPAPEMINIENLKLAARMAGEWGADFLKMPYRPGYEEVVNGTFIPIVVLGGAKTNSEEEFLASIKDAIDAGSVGCAIGRNAWGAANPTGMVKALNAIIHDGADAATAAKFLK